MGAKPSKTQVKIQPHVERDKMQGNEFIVFWLKDGSKRIIPVADADDFFKNNIDVSLFLLVHFIYMFSLCAATHDGRISATEK